VFEILSDTFSKFYDPFENLAIDDTIISFKGRVIFKQYVPPSPRPPKKDFSIRIFKLCDLTGYTYDMSAYLGKDRQRMAQHVTATHVTVTEMTRKIEARGQKLYMNNFFSSPELFGNLTKKLIYCCGTVRPNRRGISHNLAHKTIKLKWTDICIRTRANVMVLLWWDKRDICMLMNIHDAPAGSNFCNGGGRAINPQIVMEYNRYMGYVNKRNKMANTYSIRQHTI